MKKDIKIIEEMIESLRRYKSQLLDILMINESDEFANEQYNIVIHQIYVLEEAKRKMESDKDEIIRWYFRRFNRRFKRHIN